MNSNNGSGLSGFRPSLPSLSGGVSRPAVPAVKGISFWHLAWGNKFKILACILLGALVGVVKVTLTTPLYQATTTVELVGFNSSFMGMSQVDPQAGTDSNTASPGNIQTQVRVLTSRTLLNRVFERMNLELTPVTSSPATIFTNLRNRIPFLRQEPMLQSREALATAVRTASVRAVGATRLIEISCQSTSPEIAANFVNTLASEHVSQTMAERASATQHTSQWMESQMEEARARLQEASEKLRDFVQKSGMDFFPAQTTLADSKMRTLQADVSGIQADRIAKQARWELARTTPLASLPDVMNDGTLLGLKSEIATLRREMAPLTATLTPEHYKVQRIQAQIDETQRTLEKEEAAFLKRTQSDYEAALRQEKLLLGAYNAQTHTVSGQADKAGQYAMLQRDVDTQQQLYNMLLQQSNQAALIALAPSSGIRVVDAATPNPNPSSPAPEKDIPSAALAGGAVGYALLFLRELAKRKKGTTLFDMPGHTQALLGVPELGVIPTAEFAPRPKRRLLPGNRKKSQAESLVHGIDVRDEPDAGRPNGGIWSPGGSLLLSESFRQTLVSLLRARPADHNPAYVITSAGPGEGKTMLSAHLARAMAEIGQRVLLVDADLRKPHLHNLLGVDDHEGLSDMLADSSDLSELDLDQYTQSTPFDNLSVMTHGRIAVESPAVLFFSPRVGELIARLKTQFDCVLFDTAPSLLFPDARLWGKYADGIVLVVRAGVTTREGASAACERFSNDGIPVLGTILNDWTPDPGSRIGSYYYGQYYARSSEKK
jgi:capsular exopolysaccharide synthesis family protein